MPTGWGDAYGSTVSIETSVAAVGAVSRSFVRGRRCPAHNRLGGIPHFVQFHGDTRSKRKEQQLELVPTCWFRIYCAVVHAHPEVKHITAHGTNGLAGTVTRLFLKHTRIAMEKWLI